MAKRIVIKDGDVFRVDLPDGRHAFAQRLRHPLYAFFAPRVTNKQPGAQLIGEHLFSVWIFDAAPKRENWARIGRFPISERLSVNPWFAKQDILNGKITRYRNAPTLQAGYEEVDFDVRGGRAAGNRSCLGGRACGKPPYGPLRGSAKRVSRKLAYQTSAGRLEPEVNVARQTEM